MTGEELMELAERVSEQWKEDSNVLGVGFGIKERSGELIEGLTLRFTVRQKFNSKDEILKADSTPIPPIIDGIQTDVNVVSGVPLNSSVGSRGTKIEEPLKGGVSTSVLGDFLPFPTGYGTLGSVCYYNDGRLMALSNAHVWGPDILDDIIQPFLPVGEYTEAVVKVLTCGPIISSILEGKRPSILTGILQDAASAAWIAAVASDAKDPHRRGQEATSPTQLNEKTVSESIHFSAEPKGLPLPGMPYSAAVDWQYKRETDQADYSFNVNENKTNEHILINKYMWTQFNKYPRGQIVEIMAILETSFPQRPDAFHVVAHLNPSNQPDRLISRILHPTACEDIPFLFVNFPNRSANTPAIFPFTEQGIKFYANQTGSFQDVWSSPVDGNMELQFPSQGLSMDIPPSTRAELHVIRFNNEPIVLKAYDNSGNLLTKTATQKNKGEKEILSVEGTMINQLVLEGGENEGYLIMICLKLLRPLKGIDATSGKHFLCYRGQYQLDPTELTGSWDGLLSAQTVNTVPKDTPPTIAAQTIGGIESNEIASIGVGCMIVFALDHLFDVI
ncbi:hypothetical protein IIU_06510 [Bacillus cereus VD133]|uniref:Uncharacterized protein n=1 Tax=Bacillus cereus VD133 TaxID=1053233 RepID=A0A9W5UZ99_BACCE|nr:hypothetical protein [Bacillus cereus]EOO24937.1 hypothetical protein IIU_06510 [Bacillus cereus VD133]